MSEPFIHGIGVHVLCADAKLREVKMTPKQASGVLNYIIHKQGGTIQLSVHTLVIHAEAPPVSKGEEGYIPLARQIKDGKIYTCWRCGFLTHFLKDTCPNCQGVATLLL